MPDDNRAIRDYYRSQQLRAAQQRGAAARAARQITRGSPPSSVIPRTRRATRTGSR